MAGGLTEHRLGGRTLEAGAAEQAIYWVGMLASQVFALGICPQIQLGTRDIDGARREQGQKFVLIDRQVSLSVVVAPEILAEPVWEPSIQVACQLTETAARERCSTAAGVVRDGDGKARVRGSGPQRGLGEARMPGCDDTRGIDAWREREHIQDAAHAPRPGADRGPLVRGRPLPSVQEQRMNPVLKAVVVVWIEIPGVHGGNGVAAGDE